MNIVLLEIASMRQVDVGLHLTIKRLDTGLTQFLTLPVAHDDKAIQEQGFLMLSAICHSVGVVQIENTDDLLGIPFMAEVEGNQIVRYFPNQRGTTDVG